VIFRNPAGAPELACDACGCRWFDRMSPPGCPKGEDRSAQREGTPVIGACYECGTPVSPEAQAQYRDAIAAFRGTLAPPQATRASSQVPAEIQANERRSRWPS